MLNGVGGARAPLPLVYHSALPEPPTQSEAVGVHAESENAVDDAHRYASGQLWLI